MKDECYQFLKNQMGKVDIVGFGSYGEVKLARNTENSEIVAIKMIYNKNAKEEIDVHHKLNHPNIIKLLNYYYEKEKNVTYMVLEYASGGSLNEKIKFGYGQLSKQLVRRYFRDICEAIKYLHQNNFMHRDIKPENILITKDNHAKLCDFGFASILEYRSTLCGTFEYMAPEMIQKKPYDYKIDVWALGILLFELIQGFAPFRGETGEEVITEMKKPLIFSSRFDNIEIDLIKKILRVNAENRMEISKILESPYFTENRQDEEAEGEKEKAIKVAKDMKQLKDQPTKDAKIDNLQKLKKEGEKKFDFLNKKGDLKREKDDKRGNDKIEQHKQKGQKRQFPKEYPKDDLKKQEIKKQFKPYIPPNFQNSRSGIKSPLMKPLIPTSFIPTSPSGFQPNQHHQFNSSMQIQATHTLNPNSSFSSTTYPGSNPNASMTSMTSIPTKFFPSNPISQTPPYQPQVFVKPVGPSYYIEQRSPLHQPFNPQPQTNVMGQQFGNNIAWKKS